MPNGNAAMAAQARLTGPYHIDVDVVCGQFSPDAREYWCSGRCRLVKYARVPRPWRAPPKRGYRWRVHQTDGTQYAFRGWLTRADYLDGQASLVIAIAPQAEEP